MAAATVIPVRRRSRSWRSAHAVFLVLCLGWQPTLVGGAVVSQYFEMLQGGYRNPSQCERMKCLSVRLNYCRDHLQGYYLYEQGCSGKQICTDCDYGNASVVTRCRCENPPYVIEANYGQECNIGKVCAPGQGICYRPCHTFLHSTECPKEYCYWNTAQIPYQCSKRIIRPDPVVWALVGINDPTSTAYTEGMMIVNQTNKTAFPMSYADFKTGAEGYRIKGDHAPPGDPGQLLTNITKIEVLFLSLDDNSDSFLSPAEFSKLPSVLEGLNTAVSAQQLAKAGASSSTDSHASTATSRRLQDSSDLGANSTAGDFSRAYVTPEICGSLTPRQFYCSFDESCKSDCEQCGWKGAKDAAFSTCVRPTPETCRADGGRVYCRSDDRCHPPGDCKNCVDRPVVDFSQFMCLAIWWDPEPLQQWTNWVCRDRNKVGMPCRHDQDCIYGLKRCLGGRCAPKQPYNQNQTCVDDFDCPHKDYFCPRDPTGGNNKYWVQYCREQRGEGMTCEADRECKPDLRCNTAEPMARCRRLFSLPWGSEAASDLFCTHGWRDLNGKCAPPAKSKEAGRACTDDSECISTDVTGRKGVCTCKAWWNEDQAKYCLPVPGDFQDHMVNLRNYMWYRALNCGSFWTEDECLRIGGDRAMRLKLAVECEIQQLSGGPYLPPPECGIKDTYPQDRFSDPCQKLADLGGPIYSGACSLGWLWSLVTALVAYCVLHTISDS